MIIGADRKSDKLSSQGIFVTEQKFKTQVKTNKNNGNFQVIYQNKILTKGPVFSKQLRNQAINLIKKYQKNQIFCLLVENDWSLTFWIDKGNNSHLEASPIQRTFSLPQESKNQESPLIACIDDSKIIQLQVKRTLELAGYQVLDILDPISAIKIISKHQPKLILMDINMPFFNGYELSQMLGKSRKLKNIPIAMFSAQNSFIDRIRAKMCGTVGFLKKPISGFELIDFVNCIVPVRSELISDNL